MGKFIPKWIADGLSKSESRSILTFVIAVPTVAVLSYMALCGNTGALDALIATLGFVIGYYFRRNNNH